VEIDQTHWVPRQRRGPLPTFYYHEHFLEMLGFVRQHYSHVLLEDHVRFLDDFDALSREAQCLYVRLVNRKGRVFAIGKLRYPELGDTRPLVDQLRDRDWVSAPDAEHFEDVLRFLTRDEICHVLLERFTGMSRTLRKPDLVAFAIAHCEPRDFLDALNTRRILVQGRAEEVRFILFLYFGRIQDGLSQFTMRDLGLVRTQAFQDNYEPRFSDRTEAMEHFYFSSRLDDLKRSDDPLPMVREMTFWPDPQFAGSAAVRNKLAYRLGRKLEQAGDVDSALDVFRKGESTRCSERVIRLMLANDQRDDAENYLERCLTDPRSDEEWLVARDIYEQKFEKKRTSALTDLLRAADTIDIDESRIGAPERATIEHYESQGIRAFRTENTIWRTLFGLLFWDELFESDEAGLHSPFEFLPSTLSDGTFSERFRDRIDQKLARLENTAATRIALLKTSTEKFGAHNGVFRWHQPTIDAVFALISNAPGESIAKVIRRFCVNYKDARYGYPDLMLVENRAARFVEVKTEGDQLRRNQMLRIEQLRASGFAADVVRVRWVLDPQQTYVVVDVETTGGRGENHRVTEIGAVKVENGEIVDKFQTLLNPQRAIPTGITRLTGISQDMVAGAPYFADIADEFETFLRDSIFVAHNVEFDYGFIAGEFARIGRPFRYPKLCTCASMRKLYPGHKSYSLASLARAYDIPLKHHHRAMCDAEAAAELLILVNEKRQDQLAEDGSAA
jgi:DNA polymerase-3 subunit epsilon